jgi:hypothetical protein
LALRFPPESLILFAVLAAFFGEARMKTCDPFEPFVDGHGRDGAPISAYLERPHAVMVSLDASVVKSGLSRFRKAFCN